MKSSIFILLSILFATAAIAEPQPNEISFRRSGEQVIIKFHQRETALPIALLRSHLRATNLLNTWWFNNQRERWKFARIAQAKPEIQHPMTVERAVEKRFLRERAKIASFVKFFCDVKHGTESCDDGDAAELLRQASALDSSLQAQRKIGIINGILDKLIKSLLETEKVSRSNQTGSIPYSVFKSYTREPPELEFLKVPNSKNVKSFELQKRELTQLEWFLIFGTNPSFFSDRSDCPDSYIRIEGFEMCPEAPAETFRVDDAFILLRKMNFQKHTDRYRLPTDAEWEHAARAGTTTEFSFGSDEARLSEFAWSHQNFATHPMSTGLLKPNPWGFFDMHGNVWEIVTDGPTNSSKKSNIREYTIRGGSWFDFPKVLQNGEKLRIYDAWTCYDVGIRLAR